MTVLNKSLWASRLDHRRRWIAQKMRPPAVAIAGGYHSGNLGDMALAYSAKGQIAHRACTKDAIGIQTIYNLPDWPRAGKVVVGGGALLSSSVIKNLKHYTKDQPQNVGIIGVDFLKSNLDERDVDFLREVCFLSFRSNFSLEAARSLYSLYHARLSPDIVFARDDAVFAIDDRSQSDNKILAINVTPGLGRDQPRDKEEDKVLHSIYLTWVREIINTYLAAGYLVESIPFTHRDEKVVRENLSDLPIHHNSYTHSVRTTLSRVQRCDTILCSRYHALIFGCLLEKKVIPFCYAKKNYALCERYLYLTGSGFRELERSDLTSGHAQIRSEPQTLAPGVLTELQKLVHREFDDLSEALFH